MALFFVAATFTITDQVRLLLILAATPVMMALAIIDIEHRRLPNGLLAILAVLFLALRYAGDRDFMTATMTATAVFAAAIILDAVGRRTVRQGLAMGDAKLMAAAALALPLAPLLAALGVAGVAGAAVAALPRMQNHRRGGHFPFGPALLLAFWGAIVAL